MSRVISTGMRTYIGEGDNVFKRLLRHNKNEAKDFWERTIVMTPRRATAVDAKDAV